MMEGAISGKTGFTAKAGYCYVAAFERDGERYCIALLACGWPNNKTYKWKDLDLAEVRKTLDETGVTLVSMCTTEFNLTNPEMREKWLDGLRETCEAAEKLAEENYAAWCRTYEEFYGIPVSYGGRL